MPNNSELRLCRNRNRFIPSVALNEALVVALPGKSRLSVGPDVAAAAAAAGGVPEIEDDEREGILNHRRFCCKPRSWLPDDYRQIL